MPKPAPRSKRAAAKGDGAPRPAARGAGHALVAPTSSGPTHHPASEFPQPTHASTSDDARGVDASPQVMLVKPPNQLQLTEEELNEEVTRILAAKDPNAAANIARFSHKERVFKFEAVVDHHLTLLSLENKLVHRDSEEARRQLQNMPEASTETVATSGTGETREEDSGVVKADGTGGDGSEKADDDEDEEAPEDDTAGKPTRSQFNISDRASQTQVMTIRERAMQTEPPAAVSFSENVSRGAIFDEYMDDLRRKQAEKEKKESKERGGGQSSTGPTRRKKPDEEDVIHSEAMARSTKIMERMLNLNTFDEIAQDFRYWDDLADQYRDEGSLLPLWRFGSEKIKKRHVTALCWNKKYPDLFAAGYGSYDFKRQTTGLICCFSLKNPSAPECSFQTESGVMCLDFHSTHSSLLAVGLYDGTTLVFDVRNKSTRPIFQSTVRTGKHTDPVREVRWATEDRTLTFYSISSDGHVSLWALSKSELQHTNIMELRATRARRVEDPSSSTTVDEESLGLACGSCLDFNSRNDHLFVVGTEEGAIHKCSTAFTSQFLETYEGHKVSVYAVRWNPFHPDIFLSCSADWTVKLWSHKSKAPLLVFDLEYEVGDIAWASFSSTVFAAVTSDGKVHVYDINENTVEPICMQKVVAKAKATHLAFNPKEPVIVVGDDKGGILVLKLSPNLRKRAPVEEGKSVEEVEFERVDRLLRNDHMESVAACVSKGDEHEEEA